MDISLSRLDNRYELHERLGVGGTARVYKAWDTHLERWVAIKILHDHLADDPTFKERFEREAKIVAGLNHANIVQLYDFKLTERDGQPLYYMVMSYVQGQTLRALLDNAAVRRQPLVLESTRAIITDLAGALQYAHAQNMAHRDLKPGNVLIDASGKAVLTDFGIARMVSSARLTMDGTSTGTPAYMSPEQATGSPGDARSDLYSLGVILFEMLANQPPFDDETSLAIMLKHVNEPPPRLPSSVGESTAALDAFLKRALAKAPDDRFQSAQAFSAALRPLLEEHETTIVFDQVNARPTAAVTAAQPTTTRRTITLEAITALSRQAIQDPRISAGLIALVVSLVVVLTAVLLLSRDVGDDAPPATIRPTARVSSMTGDPGSTSTFDVNNMQNMWWPQGDDGTIARTIADGRYTISNLEPGLALTTLYKPEERYTNLSILMEATISEDSAPASACGLVFRYQDEDNYNVFAIDGLGRYSIWVRKDGVWRELRGEDEQWTPSAVIRPAGEPNSLTVSINGETLLGYVNNRRVAFVRDLTFSSGNIGIYSASDAGTATVSVEMFQTMVTGPRLGGS